MLSEVMIPVDTLKVEPDITSAMTDRQKKYEKGAEKLSGVRELLRSLVKCHMLNENIDMDPFVWTTC